MKLSFVLLSLVWCHLLCAESERVSLQMTEASSQSFLSVLLEMQTGDPLLLEWKKTLNQRVSLISDLKGVKCVAKVWRPDLKATEPLIHAHNQVNCRVKDMKSTFDLTFEFKETPVERWGDRFDTAPFSILEPLASPLFEVLSMNFTRHTDDSRFSAILGCDYVNNLCSEAYYLNQKPGDDQIPAQMFCARYTELKDPGVNTIGMSLTEPNFKKIVEEQLKSGIRKVYKTRCSWLDPKV